MSQTGRLLIGLKPKLPGCRISCAGKKRGMRKVRPSTAKRRGARDGYKATASLPSSTHRPKDSVDLSESGVPRFHSLFCNACQGVPEKPGSSQNSTVLLIARTLRCNPPGIALKSFH